jgi:hypothetical protein
MDTGLYVRPAGTMGEGASMFLSMLTGTALLHLPVNVLVHDLLDLLDEAKADNGRILSRFPCDFPGQVGDDMLIELKRGSGNFPEGILQLFFQGRTHSYHVRGKPKKNLV